MKVEKPVLTIIVLFLASISLINNFSFVSIFANTSTSYEIVNKTTEAINKISSYSWTDIVYNFAYAIYNFVTFGIQQLGQLASILVTSMNLIIDILRTASANVPLFGTIISFLLPVITLYIVLKLIKR